jgi:hypothetical protein
MKSTKKLKVGQLKLPTLPTENQKAALDASLAPSGTNPYLTKEDSPLVKTKHFTDYDDTILGNRIEWRPVLELSKEYIPGSLKIYFNGMRLNKGMHNDYRESSKNIFIINFPVYPGDTLMADYNIIAETEHVTDYSYDITGDRSLSSPILMLSRVYVPGSTRVYLNGMLQAKGTDKDYVEIPQRSLQFNFPLSAEDTLIADYKFINTT